jgi:hypothetical protein
MKFKMPKTPKIPKIPNPIDVIVDPIKDNVVDPIADIVDDGLSATEKAWNDTVNFAESLVKDTSKAVAHATQICASQATEYSNQGFDVASDTWKQGTDSVIKYTERGVELVEYGLQETYEWLDANACYLGLNFALTTGCVLYFTPKPKPTEPGTITSTAISTTYLSYLATQGTNIAMSCAVAKIITESIVLIPGVKGNVNEKTLYNVICNAIATCNPVVLSVSLATPAGVGIFIGSVISPLVAQLVCEQIAPKGFKDAIS